ncbi:MAG: hemolytic protein HlpA [Microscillaceae bacterium]
MFNVPILFLIFNRPETTRVAFERIRHIKPKYLYLAADGPRVDRPEDLILCQEARDIVLKNIDWECKVELLLREKNLGCGKAVSEAIYWFFEQVEYGIILEDDIIPNNTFFKFCEILLKYYQFDHRVMMISGLNVSVKWKPEIQSYHFSNFGGIWGWASWRRAWQHYDFNIKLWQYEDVKALIRNFFSFDENTLLHRQKMYDDLYEGKIDTWDLQWGFSKLINSGLNIIPATNLISNIGCGYDATHIKGEHPWANLPVMPIDEIRHPKCIMADIAYDKKHLGINSDKVDRFNFIKKIFSLK